MVDKITNIDECEAEYKKLIGMSQTVPGCWSASADNIALYADALGDGNPLWNDENYAKKSRLGKITAPPTFLFKVNVGDWGAVGGPSKLPRENITQIFGGAEFEMFKPIYAGDVFTVKQSASALRRVDSKTRGAILFGTGENQFVNQKKELVGITRITICLAPVVRAGAGGVKPIHGHDEAKSGIVGRSPDVLAFEQNAKRRGGTPRYWEDVKEGEEMLPNLEKGVLTATEITRWQLNVLSQRPRFAVKPRSEEVIVGLARAATSQLAHGNADPEDFGPQRCAWVGQFATDWMGDAATLKKFSAQVRAPNMMGDINVLKGKVTKKYIENGEHLVDCDMWVENQAGNVTAPGKATILLPTKK